MKASTWERLSKRMEFYRNAMEQSGYKVLVYNGVEHYQYMVGRDGSIFSVYSQRMVTLFTTPIGYKVCNIHKDDNKRQLIYIHRAVAYTFLGESDLEVNHKDGDKLNNNVENLEWVSHLENMRHYGALGTRPKKYNKKKIEA